MLSEAGGRGSPQPSKTNTVCYIGVERRVLHRATRVLDKTAQVLWGQQRRRRENMTSSGKERREKGEVGTRKGEIRGQTHSFVADKTSCWDPRGRGDVWGTEKREGKPEQKSTYCSSFKREKTEVRKIKRKRDWGLLIAGNYKYIGLLFCPTALLKCVQSIFNQPNMINVTTRINTAQSTLNLSANCDNTFYIRYRWSGHGGVWGWHSTFSVMASKFMTTSTNQAPRTSTWVWS